MFDDTLSGLPSPIGSAKKARLRGQKRPRLCPRNGKRNLVGGDWNMTFPG